MNPDSLAFLDQLDPSPDCGPNVLIRTAAVWSLTAAVRAALALADELDAEAKEREQMADRLPDQPAYRMEINRLVVGASHQSRAARRIRSTVTAALAPVGGAA